MNARTPRIVNRKARHQYEIIDDYEAGIALKGTEIKSVRQGLINLREGFVRVDGGDLTLYNVHIAPYESGNRFNHDPIRPRRLLMHRNEIDKLHGKVKTRGFTLVPLELYFKNGRAKLKIGLARGKTQVDRRQEIAEREAKRRIERALSGKPD